MLEFEKKFFLPYQRRWISDTSRLKIIEKSRQIGISLASAYRLVREHSYEGCRYDAWISSRDEIQAKLFLDDCKKFSQILHVAAQDLGKEVIAYDKKSGSASLLFRNNRTLYSLSSNPDAQAGKRGTRVLDEFALHPNPRLLYAIAYPGITWGGQLEIISTHRGSDNFFYNLIKDITENGNPKQFSHHKVTLQDALEQGFLRKLKAKVSKNDPIIEMDETDYFDYIRRSCPDRETFLQEYMCEPYDSQSIFLPTNLVEDAEMGYDPRKITAESDLFLGIDVGRTNDLTVFWLLASVGEVLMTKDVIVLKDRPFSEQEVEFYKLLTLPMLRRACIDQTGIGRQFAERAMERFGKYKVEGITFTNSVKEQLAYLLRATFEDRAIGIPDDKHIRADLRAIKKESTFAGNLRFAAEHTGNGHGDRFWALALAIHAAQSAQSRKKVHLEPILHNWRVEKLLCRNTIYH
ncbi:MAG: terminase family protein [Puniceicoccales bacterium]|jgi:phage FluMu gp28-like protein|nr:terminase family protein [Puniceicoccales bacterium]